MTGRQRDRILAVLAAVFAASYVAAAHSIEDSLLADSVGAGGVPQGVGIAMGICAVVLFAKTFIGAPTAAHKETTSHSLAEFFRTGMLVVILIAYGLLLPVLGYPLSLSLMVLAAGWLAGALLRYPLLLCAAATGPVLWVLFDQVLHVHMPLGTLWQ